MEIKKYSLDVPGRPHATNLKRRSAVNNTLLPNNKSNVQLKAGKKSLPRFKRQEEGRG